jgi:Animal haem peroxidase
VEEAAARHGTAVPRGEKRFPKPPRWDNLRVWRRDLPAGRFGRMFPKLDACNVSDQAIGELVTWMGDQTRSQPSNPRIPAGFTYLGQFIDHDITFDPASKLDQIIDPLALENFRTPRLDLDSVYGAGPVAQPFLYDWKDSEPAGTRLLVGRNEVDELPRNQQGRALIGDMRNDENAIVAQLHLLFIRFHNAVVDRLVRERALRARDELFDEAQRIVRWHYQWIVVHEFLPAVVGEAMANDVIASAPDGSAPTIHRRYFKWAGRDPFIPVEFSGAAYRFGHSMVRGDYGLKRIPQGAGVAAAATRTFLLFPALAGFTWLREELVIDWERFFDLPGSDHPPQASQKIDTALVRPLFNLPEDPNHPGLARRNLQRGTVLGLPSGQAVADRMDQRLLTDEELQLEHIPRSRNELKSAAPLWFYILCETARAVDVNGRPEPGEHLGPVGGRIVAEVLAGLLEGDRKSYLHSDPPWQPRELGTDGTFTMADFIKIAQSWRAPEPG